MLDPDPCLINEMDPKPLVLTPSKLKVAMLWIRKYFLGSGPQSSITDLEGQLIRVRPEPDPIWTFSVATAKIPGILTKRQQIIKYNF
jgi:hypothetical protein